MSKIFETTVEIKGAIGSSFTSAFRTARTGMTDLREEARAVQRELDRLGADFRNGRIHQSQYTEETRRLRAELDNLESRQKRFEAFKNTVTNGWNTTKAVASIAAIGAATAAVATTFDAINVAADFEAQLSKVQAKTQGTSQEMSALRQTALELGASTSLSASETAKAMDDLAAGGMNVNNIIAAMPGIIAGAEASGEDLSTVSNTVSTALSIWGLKAEEASRVSDVLAMSANLSSASVEDMAYAFKYAGKPAADLGLSLEEVSAATAIMTNSGLDGSSAGTSLRASLLALNAPANKQQKLMNKLGFSMRNSNGEAKSLSKIVEELTEATEGMAEAEKVATMQTLVGTEAVSGFLSLMSAGPKEIDKMTTSLENSGGAAAKSAAIMMDNYAGAKEQMLGAVESAKIAFATPILPVLEDVMNGIASIVENNIGNIEKMGNSVAQVLSDITAPFAMTEPVKPEVEPIFKMGPDYVDATMKKYQEDLAKYEMFQGMDTGEKVSYMLDETVSTIEEWLGGDGGAAMQRIFTEVGTIAGKAWLTAFTTSAKGAVGELAEGNFAGALAMGAAANSLSGGLLLSGGLAAGKWALGKGKNLFGSGSKQNTGGNAASTVIPNTNNDGKKTSNTTKTSSGNAATPVSQPKGNSGGKQTSNTAKTSSGSATSSLLPKGTSKWTSAITKFAGKAALPITALASVASIVTADDKAEAAGGAVGSLAGGLGGAKVGAAIGTAIAPGVGTAVGGAIGGLVGSFGGSAIGSWVGGLFGKKEEPAVAATPQTSITDTTALNQSNTALTSASNSLGTASQLINESFTAVSQNAKTLAHNTSNLVMYVGLASGQIVGSFTPIQSNGTVVGNNLSILAMNTGLASGQVVSTFTTLQNNTMLVSNNMSILASYVGQASGWLVALQGIQPAAQRVINALTNLEQRINAIELPNSGTSRRLAYE